MEYVKEVLHPYFSQQMEESKVDHCVLILDCWPVQASEAFRAHIYKEYPYLHLIYVPGGLTPVAQPLDVGCQR